MPTATADEAITPKTIRAAEQALIKALALRNADKAKADQSEEAFRSQCLDSSLGGVTYTRINELTGLSKSRIDQILRGERQGRVRKARAAARKKS